MTLAPHKKFTFDTEFDDVGGIASEPVRAKQAYTPEEVELEKAKAYADGERSVVARAEQLAAAALADISAQVRAAMPALAAVAHEHRAATAVLSLACGKVIAGAALEKFPDAPVEAALEALAREIEAEPRLLVRANADLVERMQTALNKTADACGFAGKIVVKGDPAMAPAAFVLDWADGRAVFDPVEAAARVELALNNALEAEGLHAEPLIPPTPAPGA